MHAELVCTTIAPSYSAIPLLPLCRSSSPSSASPRPSVRESFRCSHVLKIHLLQAVLQRRFRWVRAVVKGDLTLDSKLISKDFIIPQLLDNHFNEIIHRISLKISKGRFRINRPVLDIRNDIIYLGIRREEGARGKGSRAVEFPPDLLLELGKVKPRDYAVGVKPVYWVGRITLSREGRICLDSDRLRQRVMAAIEEAE